MSQLFTSKRGQSGELAYAHVALERGIDTSPTGLTYEVPPHLADVAVGERVLVPLGRANKQVPGYVVELSTVADLEGKTVKPILSRDPFRLSLPGDLIELARWISSYYCCPLGMVLATMLPAAVKRGTGAVVRTVVKESDPDGIGTGSSTRHGGRSAAADGLRDEGTDVRVKARRHPDRVGTGTGTEARGKKGEEKLTKLQWAVLEAARRTAARGAPWVEIRQLADEAGARTVGPVKQLIKKGRLESKWEEVVVSDLDLRASRAAEPSPPVSLNPFQHEALEHLVAHVDRGFGAHLLHGVTGSGKTEVYLRLIEHILNAKVKKEAKEGGFIPEQKPGASDSGRVGPGIIVLVPEIALTPQTVARFLSRFDSVAVLHSGLTAAQRHAQWRRIREGSAQIVVGARSAIFAPIPDLVLIIVDEEHDHSYKQDQLPRYHARDVAVKRGQLKGIPVVLGSATPSLESFYNAIHRRTYHLLKLPKRVAGMKLPPVEIVDMTEERRKRYQYTGKTGVHLFSLRLETRLRQTLSAAESTEGAGQGQAILLLNRRGFANYIACPDHRCGWMMSCDYCDATVVYHKDQRLPAGGLVRCHHCEAEQLLPAVCPICGRRVSVFGGGTQRVEEELAQKFPAVRAARMDSDTMRRGQDYQETLDRFRRGEIDVLLGTQMIAKGLDFPAVRLVGVISGDTALHLPDFRAAERTFQLIAQVAGRAGRSVHPGRVIVQTFSPDDPVIALAAQHDYDGFAAREIQLREQVGLPPVTRMARIVIRDKDHLKCTQRAMALAARLEVVDRKLQTRVRSRGPMPCPIARIAEFHRQQIELIAAEATQLQRLMTALRNSRSLVSDSRTAVDVDPVDLL